MLPQIREQAGCWCILDNWKVLDAYDTKKEAVRERERLIRPLIVADLDRWRRWKCMADGRED